MAVTKAQRPCAACGVDQAGRKVWEQSCNRKHVICMACGPRYTFTAESAGRNWQVKERAS